MKAFAPPSTMPCPAVHENVTGPLAGCVKANRYTDALCGVTFTHGTLFTRKSAASTPVTASLKVTVVW